jgi:hypothetical protein
VVFIPWLDYMLDLFHGRYGSASFLLLQSHWVFLFSTIGLLENEPATHCWRFDQVESG